MIGIRKRISVDFDHVIYDGSFEGVYEMPKPPIKGAREALEMFSKEYDVIIWTARLWDKYNDDPEQREMILKWLFYNGFERQTHFHHVTNKKIPSLAYIDDKGVHFDNWKDTLIQLKNLNII